MKTKIFFTAAFLYMAFSAVAQIKKADLSSRTPLPAQFVKSAEFEISNPTYTGNSN
jgi:hypothetical protein